MFKIFLFLLIFTPLAFGTVEPWSYAVMEILTFLALAMFVTRVLRKKETFLALPGIIPFLLFLAYILFQTIPLPSVFIKLLSPTAYDLHSTAASISNAGQWMTISVHPAATVREFFRWATYAAFYIVTIQLPEAKYHYTQDRIHDSHFRCGSLLLLHPPVLSDRRYGALVPAYPCKLDDCRALYLPQSLCRADGNDISVSTGPFLFLQTQNSKPFISQGNG